MSYSGRDGHIDYQAFHSILSRSDRTGLGRGIVGAKGLPLLMVVTTLQPKHDVNVHGAAAFPAPQKMTTPPS